MTHWFATSRDSFVCGTCGELRGPFVWRLKGVEYPRVQECGCERQRRAKGQRPETWLGFDFNTVAELCHACGCEVLTSGSRFSIWFCTECRDRATALNAEVGQPVVPIGRHSLMHGIAMRAQPTDAEIGAFVSRFGTLVDRMNQVHAWAGEVVRTNLAGVGLSDATDHELAVYLDATSGLDRDERFEAMVTSLTQSG
jgi:hypothetical protein